MVLLVTCCGTCVSAGHQQLLATCCWCQDTSGSLVWPTGTACGLRVKAGPARGLTAARGRIHLGAPWLTGLDLISSTLSAGSSHCGAAVELLPAQLPTGCAACAGVGPDGRVPAAHGAGPEPQQLQWYFARGLGRGRGVVPQPHRAVRPLLSAESCRAGAQVAPPVLGALSGCICRRSHIPVPIVRRHLVVFTSVLGCNRETCAAGGALGQGPGGCAAPRSSGVCSGELPC